AAARSERLGEGDELAPPRHDAAELLRERGRDRIRHLAVAEIPRGSGSKIAEIELVQGHRPAGVEFRLLQRPKLVAGNRREVDRGELLAGCIERSYRASVVVLVMADDEAIREAVHRPWLAWNRSDRMVHGKASSASGTASGSCRR